MATTYTGLTVATILSRVADLLEWSTADATQKAKIYEAMNNAAVAACDWEDWWFLHSSGTFNLVIDQVAYNLGSTGIWTGDNIGTAQVDHVTPGLPCATGAAFTITLTNEFGESSTISFTVAAVETVKAVVEGLQTAAAAAKTAGTAPWDEVTVTEDDAKVIITADTAGTWFTCTAATDGAGSNTRSASVANVGFSGIKQIEGLWWDTASTSGRRRLYPIDRETFLTRSNYETTSGQPRTYTLTGRGTISLHPTPSAVKQCTAYFKLRHPTLSDTAYGNDLLIPEEYHAPIYIDGAVWALQHEVTDPAGMYMSPGFVGALKRMSANAMDTGDIMNSLDHSMPMDYQEPHSIMDGISYP